MCKYLAYHAMKTWYLLIITRHMFRVRIWDWAVKDTKPAKVGQNSLSNHHIWRTTQLTLAIFEYVDLEGATSLSLPPRATQTYPDGEKEKISSDLECGIEGLDVIGKSRHN